MVGEKWVNRTFQLINMANLGIASVDATTSIGMVISESATIIIPLPLGLLGFPWSQITGYMSLTLLLG